MTPAEILAKITGQTDRLEQLANATAKIAELEKRQTLEAHQALLDKVEALEKRPTLEAHQALLDKVEALEKRPTAEAHQAVVEKVEALEKRPTEEMHKTVVNQLAEAKKITPQAVNAEAARVLAAAGVPPVDTDSNENGEKKPGEGLTGLARATAIHKAQKNNK